ncbi:MAG: hypothetical protein R3F12_11610 [Lysobacteraceae bacterium]
MRVVEQRRRERGSDDDVDVAGGAGERLAAGDGDGERGQPGVGDEVSNLAKPTGDPDPSCPSSACVVTPTAPS